MLKRLPQRSREPAGGLALLVGIVVLMWLIEAINSLTPHGNALDGDGAIYPRDFGHVWSIFTAPFLHFGWPHLIDNTIPFVFMGVFVAVRGAARLAKVTLVVVLIGGLGTWLIAPGGTETVGASGVVFGYASYLFVRGLFDRSWVEILIGVIVGVVWGGALISSLVPHHGISWQGHASGAIGGVVAAWLLAGSRRTRSNRNPSSRGNGSPPAPPAGGLSHGDALERVLAQ
ncbi:MAG: rhomboid family intramembrane serine protease [Solirubrobacteraceae bacterium]